MIILIMSWFVAVIALNALADVLVTDRKADAEASHVQILPSTTIPRST